MQLIKYLSHCGLCSRRKSAECNVDYWRCGNSQSYYRVPEDGAVFIPLYVVFYYRAVDFRENGTKAGKVGGLCYAGPLSRIYSPCYPGALRQWQACLTPHQKKGLTTVSSPYYFN